MSVMNLNQEGAAEVVYPKLPLHHAEALTAGGIQAQIALNGQLYTLRITRAGKLILTK